MPSRVGSATLLAAVLAAGVAAAGAPAPQPPEPPPGTEAGEPEGGKPAKARPPTLKELRAMDLSVALKEAHRAAALTSASVERRELYAGLLLLNDQAEEARRVIMELYPPRANTDPSAALVVAASNLAAKVQKQPARKKGATYTEEEIKDRLRLGLVAMATGDNKAAHEAVAPLGPCPEAAENLRLALVGLSASAADAREDGVKAVDYLLRRLSGDNQLELRALALVDSVQAYGVYTERAARSCRVGEELKAYCEVVNFTCRQLDPAPAADGKAPEVAGSSYLTALDVDLTFLETDASPATAAAADRDKPPASRVILHSRGYSQVRYRTRSEIRDLHLMIRLRVPPQCVPAEGKTYSFRITVRDMATGKEGVSTAVTLPVTGP